MLWLCLSLSRLPLEAFALDPAEPATAVIEQHHGARRRVVACNASGVAAGIVPGMDAIAAVTRLADLRLLDRSARREREALCGLAVWAQQFSAFASFDVERLALWLEIGSSLRYFGGLATLTVRLRDALAQTGFSADLGVAPTAAAALVVARACAEPIERMAELRSRLDPLPLAALPVCAAWRDAFHRLGLRRIGEILDLPTDGLARRFGPEITLYLARLLGQAPQALRPCRVPARYCRRFELLSAVVSCEGLLFPIRRLLCELEGYLRGRDAALQSLSLVLHHESCPATPVEVRCSRPTRDAARLLLLVRERLQRLNLPAPVDAVLLSAPKWVPFAALQLDLLEGQAQREDDWNELLDRLRARLGFDAVRGLAQVADHRPEKAWRFTAADGASMTVAATATGNDRPLWLLEPRRLAAVPPVCGAPERIESGWWDDADVRRDYYVAHGRDDACWWLYREAESGDWFLHGLWA